MKKFKISLKNSLVEALKLTSDILLDPRTSVVKAKEWAGQRMVFKMIEKDLDEAERICIESPRLEICAESLASILQARIKPFLEEYTEALYSASYETENERSLLVGKFHAALWVSDGISQLLDEHIVTYGVSIDMNPTADDVSDESNATEEDDEGIEHGSD
jgi:late competence protein required for DNA uptake (superfamily II DNA/RNA helicase)